jgi:hypothetical protein
MVLKVDLFASLEQQQKPLQNVGQTRLVSTHTLRLIWLEKG